MQFLGHDFGGANLMATLTNIRDARLEIFTTAVVSTGTTCGCMLPKQQVEALQLNQYWDEQGKPTLYSYQARVSNNAGYLQRYEDILVTLYSHVAVNEAQEYPAQAKTVLPPVYCVTTDKAAIAACTSLHQPVHHVGRFPADLAAVGLPAFDGLAMRIGGGNIAFH
ncbi:hypothetical protein WJX72_007389 [[Myrmecia] bisecta]|uniref:Uncharacterized protein n=1 Tax=[Myrmecia] bisecta TaxID=41462 RepID=A0AAW1P4Q2_9CHLO